MDEEQGSEGRSLAETPTWAVATVITVMVSLGFFFHSSLKQLGKWLNRTKRKSLHAALEKIKEELMLFGLLSLLMGHWIIFVAKICVNSSVLSSRFYPCSWKGEFRSVEHIIVSGPDNWNISVPKELFDSSRRDYCPEGFVPCLQLISITSSTSKVDSVVEVLELVDKVDVNQSYDVDIDSSIPSS